MQFETLKFEMSEYPHVGLLTIDRPKALNALNAQVIAEIEQFTENVNSTNVRVLVITGSGDKSFVAGADIKEMVELDGAGARGLSKTGQSAFSRLEELEIPVIAAVNGFALGGGMELALACDFIFACKSAKFGLPEVGLGLIPGYGGTQRLSRVIGPAKAKMFALSGEMFSADEAYELGLVSKIYDTGQVVSGALKFASKVASKAPRAVALTKQAIQKGFDQNLAKGLEVESQLFGKVFETEDKAEGIAAFVEKRKPDFQGK